MPLLLFHGAGLSLGDHCLWRSVLPAPCLPTGTLQIHRYTTGDTCQEIEKLNRNISILCGLGMNPAGESALLRQFKRAPPRARPNATK